jgi:hypothetical protein
MAFLCGNRGPADTSTWAAGGVGSYTVGAVVDPANAIDECVETNNASSRELRVFAAPRPNLALLKPVSVTSVQGTGLEGENAVDGNMGTRWSSAFSDPQVIVVDLGARFFIDDVVLYWEAAYAREYYLKVLDVTGPWADVRHETNGTGGMATIPVGATGSKVMMAGVQRATGVEGGGLPRDFALSECFPNPFNPTTAVRFQLPVASVVNLSVYDVLGREVERLCEGRREAGTHTVHFTAARASSGTLFCRMIAEPLDGSASCVRVVKLVVLK